MSVYFWCIWSTIHFFMLQELFGKQPGGCNPSCASRTDSHWPSGLTEAGCHQTDAEACTSPPSNILLLNRMPCQVHHPIRHALFCLLVNSFLSLTPVKQQKILDAEEWSNSSNHTFSSLIPAMWLPTRAPHEGPIPVTSVAVRSSDPCQQPGSTSCVPVPHSHAVSPSTPLARASSQTGIVTACLPSPVGLPAQSLPADDMTPVTTAEFSTSAPVHPAAVYSLLGRRIHFSDIRPSQPKSATARREHDPIPDSVSLSERAILSRWSTESDKLEWDQRLRVKTLIRILTHVILHGPVTMSSIEHNTNLRISDDLLTQLHQKPCEFLRNSGLFRLETSGKLHAPVTVSLDRSYLQTIQDLSCSGSGNKRKRRS